MTTEPTPPSEPENKLARLAFAYCKIATFSLLFGRFTLPLAALLSASFFIIGYIKGKKDTKCYLRYPLLAAGFWFLVMVAWVVLQIIPGGAPSWLKTLYGL